MLVLDTDHLTAMGYETPLGQRLILRLEESGEDVATTAISVDEQLSGLLAAIHKRHAPMEQIEPYAELVGRLDFLASFLILPWDSDAVVRYPEFEGPPHQGRHHGPENCQHRSRSRCDLVDPEHFGFCSCAHASIRKLAGLRFTT